MEKRCLFLFCFLYKAGTRFFYLFFFLSLFFYYLGKTFGLATGRLETKVDRHK